MDRDQASMTISGELKPSEPGNAQIGMAPHRIIAITNMRNRENRRPITTPDWARNLMLTANVGQAAEQW